MIDILFFHISGLIFCIALRTFLKNELRRFSMRTVAILKQQHYLKASSRPCCRDYRWLRAKSTISPPESDRLPRALTRTSDGSCEERRFPKTWNSFKRRHRLVCWWWYSNRVLMLCHRWILEPNLNLFWVRSIGLFLVTKATVGKMY